MKILLVIPSLSPQLGGPSEVAIHTVSSLRAAGVEAEIATTNDNGSSVFDVPLGERVEFRGIPVFFFERSWLRKKEYIFSASLTRWLARRIPDYDLIDIHYLFAYSSTAASIISRLKGVPYIVRSMGQLAPWSLTQSAIRKRVYSALFDRSMLNHAAAIHCTTQPEAEDIKAFGVKAPPFVIPLGVVAPKPIENAAALLRKRYGIPDERKVLLFLSRLHRKKRAERLIDALAEMHALHDAVDVHLLLAGSGDAAYERSLHERVHDRSVVDRVSFIGFVRGEERDLLFQGSDIFCLPSYSENFGLVAIEAIAAGLPTVLAPGVQVADELTQAGAARTVDPEDHGFAKVLLDLMTNPACQEKLRSSGKSLIESRYNWPLIGHSLATVLRSLAR